MTPSEYGRLEQHLTAEGFDPATVFALAVLAEQLGAMRESRSGVDTGPAFLSATVERLLVAAGVDPGAASVADVAALREGARR